jgi:hypothetical protein
VLVDKGDQGLVSRHQLGSQLEASGAYHGTQGVKAGLLRTGLPPRDRLAGETDANGEIRLRRRPSRGSDE